jgi:hypothetical protein
MRKRPRRGCVGAKREMRWMVGREPLTVRLDWGEKEADTPALSTRVVAVRVGVLTVVAVKQVALGVLGCAEHVEGPFMVVKVTRHWDSPRAEGPWRVTVTLPMEGHKATMAACSAGPVVLAKGTVSVFCL